jgi:hypothetical protein
MVPKGVNMEELSKWTTFWYRTTVHLMLLKVQGQH